MNDTPPIRVPCPYILGATFNLKISPPQDPPFVIEAKVVHVYSPFTMSSAMKVALTPPPGSMMLPGEAVLKVYDRRFAEGLREEHDIDPPTYEGEARYAEYLRSGNIAQTEDEVYEQMDEVPEDDPDPLELDEHLAALLIKPFFENEKTTYSVLSSLQGKYIPTFYGTTRFLDASSPGLDTTVPGILIEFIPGTNLSQIDLTSIDLHAVCSTAVDIVNAYSDLNVLNRDVRLENFIVKPSGSEVVMIDFGHCRLRRSNEDHQAWKEAKSSEDEEGRVGCVARNRFGWNYVRSERFAIYVKTTGMKALWFNPETGKMEDYYCL